MAVARTGSRRGEAPREDGDPEGIYDGDGNWFGDLGSYLTEHATKFEPPPDGQSNRRASTASNPLDRRAGLSYGGVEEASPMRMRMSRSRTRTKAKTRMTRTSSEGTAVLIAALTCYPPLFPRPQSKAPLPEASKLWRAETLGRQRARSAADAMAKRSRATGRPLPSISLPRKKGPKPCT